MQEGLTALPLAIQLVGNRVIQSANIYCAPILRQLLFEALRTALLPSVEITVCWCDLPEFSGRKS